MTPLHVFLVLFYFGFLLIAFIVQKYSRIISNLFTNTQIPVPPNNHRPLQGERIRFKTRDGIELAGVFIRSEKSDGATIIFCHEFGCDKNTAGRYAWFLQDAGFHLLAFDFRGHGESGNTPRYTPWQWLTNHEVVDLLAAYRFAQKHPEVDPQRIGFFGISRGAGAALVVASCSSAVRAVVCDSVFSTRYTLLTYMLRWVSIFAVVEAVYSRLPHIAFRFLAFIALKATAIRHRLFFPHIEDYVKLLRSTPVLFIHGMRDSYVKWEQVEPIYKNTRGPKTIWRVPKAKHNKAVDTQPDEYKRRVTRFLVQNVRDFRSD